VPSRKKPTATNLRRNCDDRMRKYIVARGECQRCGTQSGPFECAHIIRRRFSWTRTDELNAWCLCRDCHRTVDSYVSEFNALVASTIGWDAYAVLEEQSKCRDKFSWADELERWKAMT
jgi:5-methylcytosine-specific restriction endonuclease McrA